MAVPNEVMTVLAEHIKKSGKTHREIAQEVGIKSHNLISMMKNGESKVPIERARMLAKAVGADEAAFVHLVMKEYMPEAWGAIEDLVAQNRFERVALMVLRKQAASVAGKKAL